MSPVICLQLCCFVGHGFRLAAELPLGVAGVRYASAACLSDLPALDIPLGRQTFTKVLYRLPRSTTLGSPKSFASRVHGRGGADNASWNASHCSAFKPKCARSGKVSSATTKAFSDGADSKVESPSRVIIFRLIDISSRINLGTTPDHVMTFRSARSWASLALATLKGSPADRIYFVRTGQWM